MTQRGLVVSDLRKSYRGALAVVDGVSFNCEPSTITAFLGPNGAGKSTTLRMITGLTRPDAGRSTFDDRTIDSLDNAASTVGVLLDASAAHGGRTVHETVLLACIVIGVPRSRATECLAVVGLTSASRRRVRALSLGMRQRLGLAVALVGDPAFLILDEPSNGLDPEGIAWMGRILREYADRGGTVLLSSHHLRDVERVADHFVILDKGRVVGDYRSDSAPKEPRTLAVARDSELFAKALDSRGLSWSPVTDASGFLIEAESTAIWHLAVDADVALIALVPRSQRSLHEVFLASTTGEFVGGHLVEKSIR